LVDGEPGDVYISESRNTRNGNWYLCRDRAIRWIDGRIVRLEIATDITHLKETEKTLTKAKEEAEEATRIKDKFVSLVSHDLRAPLGTIMGFLSLLRRGDYISLPDDVAKMIDASIDSGENMVKLIEDVLSASRLKTGKIVPNLSFIDLYGLTLKAVVNSRLSASRKGIELINDVPVNSRVYVDTTLMYEVLQNLVSNAIKFCSKGDTIRLSIPEGERTTLVVADSGKGISTEDLENLFSYEVKTTTPGTSGEKGTGLGLPLAYDIVKAHGGTLEAESVVGNGSEFRVKIPYARPTLLYVDDEKFARALYRLVLKNLDVNIIEAENGVQALEEMERMKPDLVITDINMPEMDGFELIENIRGNPAFDSVSIIALTSDDSIETRDRCFRLGANDFSSKEVSAADFIPRVRRYIG
jgi:signal transduction histidine kinase/CheY-like chemotaxis protein